MAQSGAILREVGTTNRTRVSDYAAAISERTALILRVHPSNFQMDGFTERAPLKALADLAHRFEVPLVEDLGSGWLGDANAPAALRDEPTIGASLTAGVDLVTFSGDKLLGGPQSGIVAGRRALVDRVRSHPLMRALRADKITYAALETTLSLWAREPLRKEIPIYRMLTTSVDEIDRRARALAARLKDMADVQVIDGDSTVGGGSAPQSAIPTRLLAVHVEGRSAADLDRRLRAHHPPVVARIQDDRVVLDLRTVAPDDDQTLFSAVEGLKASG
jgi:L-seryl-tRNA(Ser) seleniumtransferase